MTRIAPTSKSQIASDCNRNSRKSLRLGKHPLKPTLWTRDPPVLRGFCSVSEASRRSGNHPEYVATTRVWFRIAAIFLAQSDFSGESNRPLTPILLKSIAIHLPFLSRYFCKSMPSSWQKVVYQPPICITICLPFVSRYFCRSIGVRGRWDTPKFLWLRHCDFTAISAGKACDFEVVIANR